MVFNAGHTIKGGAKIKTPGANTKNLTIKRISHAVSYAGKTLFWPG
jgi:hypothetical protein